MADGDTVDPAEEPDTSATPDEVDDSRADDPAGVDDAPTDEAEAGDERTEDERELVAAGRAESRAAGGAGAGASSGGGRTKKDKATPKQHRDAAEARRTGPVTFVKQSVDELRKVVYPTGPQLANYFVVVLIFVLFVIAYVSLLDLGIGAAIFRIFA